MSARRHFLVVEDVDSKRESLKAHFMKLRDYFRLRTMTVAAAALPLWKLQKRRPSTKLQG
jgi:hypothetical protein